MVPGDARELLHEILRGVDLGITVQDAAGALVYANARAARILGFDDPSELVAASPPDVIARFEMFRFDGEPFPLADLPGRAALAGHTPPEVEIRFRTRGTTVDRWSRVRAVPVRGADGRVSHAINFFREVTDQHRAELQREFLLRAVDELNASLDPARTLATIAQLAVPTLADWCAVDLLEDGELRRVAIAHADPEKVAFVAEIQRRYPPDPDAATGVPQVVRSGNPVLVPAIPREMILAGARDLEHLRLIDLLQLRSYLAVPLMAQGRGIGAVTFAMAESGRHYDERDLEFARALADRASLAVQNARLFSLEAERRRLAEETARFAESFVAILGHDLRNPLNAVSMSASILRRQGCEPRVPIERILASTERMAVMVDQLLDLTRLRLAGGIAITPEEVELDALVDEVVAELRSAYPTREIRFDRTPVSGRWDPARLAQVISNLVGNAVQHGDPQAPVVVHAARTTSGDAELRVRNAGAPIPADVLPGLFAPYRQGASRAAGTRGLGLGLFISDAIVRAHGGRIDVRSEPGADTEFRVVLPTTEPA